MFLDVTLRRNPLLIETAQKFHQSGDIFPDTYILDLDTIFENAKALKKSADQFGIDLFYMTKQLGRNPLVSNKIQEAGIELAVVVDFKEAIVMMENGFPIGNIGHLVQVPNAFLEKVMSYGVKYITVYSIEKLKEINKIAKKLKIKQKVLIKVIEPTDKIYEGQYGGFHLQSLNELAKIHQEFTNIELSGFTSFPCLLYDGNEDFITTNNVKTIKRAVTIFDSYKISINELNIPSGTCSHTIPMIKEIGGTQGEPGHALTGTTPLHAKKDLIERPAMVYVSEISHNLDGNSFFYGGGYYRRGHLKQVIVSDCDKQKVDNVLPFDNENIDYYLSTQSPHSIGSTVIASFRTQIFVTRSDVAVVSGIQSGLPKLEGIYDSQGNLVRR